MRPSLRACLLFIVLPVLAGLGGCKGEAVGSAAPPAVEPAAASPTGQPVLGVDKTLPRSSRKVIQKAELRLELRSPPDAQAKVTALVEREGGYVESASREAPEAEGATQTVRMSLRVPSERLSSVLDRLRRMGNGRHSEIIGSQDVTEETIDLDARIRAQSELEERLLALLGNATNVEGALGVHKELANVRTEIERLKGRQRFLEREVAFSTVTLLLAAPPVERVSVAGIGQSFSSAYSDAILVGSGLIVGLVRLGGIVLPILILLGVPGVAAFLVLRRLLRARRAREHAELAAA